MRRQVTLLLVLLAAGVILSSPWAKASAAIVTDRVSGLSMVLPDGWRAVRRVGATCAFMSPDNKASLTITTVAQAQSDLDGIQRDFLRAAPKNFQGFRLVQVERRKIKGRRALAITFDFLMEYRFRQLHLKIPKPGGFIDVVFSTFVEDWAGYAAVFRNMQESIEFIF